MRRLQNQVGPTPHYLTDIWMTERFSADSVRHLSVIRMRLCLFLSIQVSFCVQTVCHNIPMHLSNLCVIPLSQKFQMPIFARHADGIYSYYNFGLTWQLQIIKPEDPKDIAPATRHNSRTCHHSPTPNLQNWSRYPLKPTQLPSCLALNPPNSLERRAC
jgi:hypothetical protein